LNPEQVTSLTERVKPALVTVRQMGRDGGQRGTGSGFVISKEGLVVTNLHVIGEGQPLAVEFVDGTKREVIEVHASDRHYDLAVLKLAPDGKDLPFLVVGDSAVVKQGDLVLGFGAPQGLSFSVVPGAISAIRKLEPGFAGEGETPEFPMLQLAMPIEQGNSGGPVVNLKGEVLGIVTLKHRVTENLGFAVPSNDLKSLLEKPNPVPMARWSTIGTLDPRQWTAVMGANGASGAEVITAQAPGDGFGGRALCVSSLPVPEEPYEVAVKVKLDEEAGAAGLVFASDGDQVHYGFYPSDGKMRLTRFEGPRCLQLVHPRPGRGALLRAGRMEPAAGAGGKGKAHRLGSTRCRCSRSRMENCAVARLVSANSPDEGGVPRIPDREGSLGETALGGGLETPQRDPEASRERGGERVGAG
jgi:serine protease Do